MPSGSSAAPSWSNTMVSPTPMPLSCAYSVAMAICPGAVGSAPSTSVQVSTPSVSDCTAMVVPLPPTVCTAYAR